MRSAGAERKLKLSKKKFLKGYNSVLVCPRELFECLEPKFNQLSITKKTGLNARFKDFYFTNHFWEGKLNYINVKL